MEKRHISSLPLDTSHTCEHNPEVVKLLYLGKKLNFTLNSAQCEVTTKQCSKAKNRDKILSPHIYFTLRFHKIINYYIWQGTALVE